MLVKNVSGVPTYMWHAGTRYTFGVDEVKDCPATILVSFPKILKAAERFKRDDTPEVRKTMPVLNLDLIDDAWDDETVTETVEQPVEKVESVKKKRGNPNFGKKK